MNVAQFGITLVVLLSTGFAQDMWNGDIKLKLTNQEDYIWSIRLTITNNDPRAAGGFLLKLRLKNPHAGSLTLQTETNLVVDSSGSDHGVWNLRPQNPFGLSGSGAAYSGSSFKVLFGRNGPLYGNCIHPELLQPEVILFQSECSAETCPSVCGDGECSAGETCSSCPADCFKVSKCSDSCGDGICSGGESGSGCEADCTDITCKAPFQFILGWDLHTTLLAAGVLVAVLFALITGLCFKYRSERQQLLTDTQGKVLPITLRRVPATSEYEEEEDARIDGSVVKPIPAVDIYAEYDEEAAPEQIPIESKPNIFHQRPWKAIVHSESELTESITSPTVESRATESEPAGLSLGIGSIESRIPGYLQDIPAISPMFKSEGLRKRSRASSFTMHEADARACAESATTDEIEVDANI